MYNKFIEFLKNNNLYDEEAVKYFYNKAIMFDYQEKDLHDFIGCFLLTDRDGCLREIKAFVPFIRDDVTILININIYVRLFLMYNKLGKKVRREMYSNTLPILFEKIYLLDNPTQELRDYEDYLNQSMIDNKYKTELRVCDELMDSYKNNISIKKLSRKAKRLVKKYQREG